MPNKRDEIIDRLSSDIDSAAGRVSSEELDRITDRFDQTIQDALKSFNSSSFDQYGFIKRMSSFKGENSQQEDMMRNVLNSIRTDHVGLDLGNQSELMLRRDIHNVCTQMPEMHDVIQVVRDSIIECNVATGEVSKSVSFNTKDENKKTRLESMVREIERKHNLPMAIKNFIVPNALMIGELYINVVPYAKLFAELDAVAHKTGGAYKTWAPMRQFHESVPQEVAESFQEGFTLDTEANFKTLMESVSGVSKLDVKDIRTVEEDTLSRKAPNVMAKEVVESDLHFILSNIEVRNGSSVMFSEMGAEGVAALLRQECGYKSKPTTPKPGVFTQFNETVLPSSNGGNTGGLFGNIDQDLIDPKRYSDIKGCYVKYLDGLRLVPLRVDRRVVGYYYCTTTLDLNNNPATSNGIIDLSYQTYTHDKKMVSQLAEIIIRSFDRKMLDKNIQLKTEIAEIIEAHKFSEGRLSFIYIPEDEIVRIVINEDENGKGHSILEPTLFPARVYLMLTLYNVIYTLNNNTTRVHYLKSSGLNKDYASQVQRTIRKFQSRRISIDDIYSYSGVMNKIGGMGEMVLPAGRSDYKAMETDTIPAVENPISMEFLEQQRRQAISGTGVPNMLVINAIDEVDFAKTLELANTRYLSTVSGYKIDFNEGLTRYYRAILRYSTDMDEDELASFRFQFNAVKQQELVITAEMINNFNSTVELEESIFFRKDELIDANNNPTELMMEYRKERARQLLPQLNIDELEKTVKKIRESANDRKMQAKADSAQDINADDLKELNDTGQ